MPKSGEKPGAGTYICTKCGWSTTLNDDTKALPICPKCRFDGYKKK